MSWRRGRRLAAAALIAAAVAGCGLGPGDESEGVATLTATRDYGAEVLVEATHEDPPESDTVLRLLDREAEITTRYGGGFVQSIEGVEGSASAGRNRDWFFYVNGVESSVGAAEVEVSGGDRVWWDHRDWTDAMRVPAVVGSWPEPLLQASATAPATVAVQCAGVRETCDEVLQRLDAEGVEAALAAGEEAVDPDAPRVLVGPWRAIRHDDAASLLDGGPAKSGVFARFALARGGEPVLEALDQRGEEALTLGRGAGLVAAVRDGERPPTWLVTGVNGGGVKVATEILAARNLEHRFAVAARGGESIPLPVAEGRG